MCDVKPFGELSKAEKMELLEAWVNGEGVEVLYNGVVWATCNPAWVSWCKYRIKPKPAPTKPSIDWGAVRKEFRYLAKDGNGGFLYLHTHKPEPQGLTWRSKAKDRNVVSADQFASADCGTCDWKDSLVERPEGV